MMHVLHYHKNPKLQLSGLKSKKKMCGVGRVVSALSCETGFAGSMLNKVIFHDARASLIQKLKLLLRDFKKKCVAKSEQI